MKFMKQHPKTVVDPNEQKGSKRRLQNGSYALVMTAIVIAVIVVVNYIVAAIPSKFTTFDVSEQKLYSISDTTKELLDSLDEDVTLYYLTVSGQEDTYTDKLLDTYEGYSDHVKVEKVNLVQNPTFAQQYTDESPTMNSIIAVCGDRSKVIDYSSIYTYDYSGYSYSASGFDGEGQITSAISYLTSEDSGKIYYTTGHGEISLSASMTETINKSNLETEELNLLTEDVPDDASALILFSPTSDITEDEAQKVLDYLEDGGHVMMVSLSNLITGAETPNFDSILEAYGVTRKGGIVLESDNSNYVNAPYFTIPTLNTSTEAASGLENTNILYALPEAVEIADTDDAAYTVSTLISSSGSSYIKTDLSGDSALQQEDTDESGSFPLAVSVEQTLTETTDGTADTEEADTESTETADDSDTTADEGVTETKASKLVYYTSPALFSQDALSSLVGVSTSIPEGNQQLFSQTITYLTDREISVSVPAKELSTPQLDDGEMSDGFAQTMGNIAMFLIPAIFLFTGLYIWIRRKSR